MPIIAQLANTHNIRFAYLDGRVTLKTLFSQKTGKTYDATVLLDGTDNGYVHFKLEF